MTFQPAAYFVLCSVYFVLFELFFAMPNTNTPTDRLTRSGSNPNTNITLSDIKDLIESASTKIVSSLRSEIDNLSATMSMILTKVKDIEIKNNSLEERCTKLELDQANLLMELEERDRRRQNVIISGLPEKLDGSVTERKEWDTQQVNELFQNLIDFNENVIKSTFRLGNASSARPRLLKVVCRDVDIKRELIIKAKTLRTLQDYDNVYLNTDLTPLQQRENKKLRDELKRRKALGEDVFIRRGKVTLRENFQ